MQQAPDTAWPALALLTKHGAAAVDLRALDFTPPATSRGVPKGAKAIRWSATITHTSPARPLVRAIRENPGEALAAAAERYLLIFRDGATVDSFDVPDKPAPRAKPAVHDDIEDMI